MQQILSCIYVMEFDPMFSFNQRELQLSNRRKWNTFFNWFITKLTVKFSLLSHKRIRHADNYSKVQMSMRKNLLHILNFAHRFFSPVFVLFLFLFLTLVFDLFFSFRLSYLRPPHWELDHCVQSSSKQTKRRPLRVYYFFSATREQQIKQLFVVHEA